MFALVALDSRKLSNAAITSNGFILDFSMSSKPYKFKINIFH